MQISADRGDDSLLAGANAAPEEQWPTPPNSAATGLPLKINATSDLTARWASPTSVLVLHCGF